ncbi:hypothetical protein SARC_04314 [Sphaeroforma arctica JP610]|uniref:RNA-dependent RNA polymerase n=1 Tax=Sphaeroforma arctica JP610 TaxID=667725 RepID=A0A0L0G2W7_9EUKA|nr:hypothetical protein SARC_04314 [Sphaeroforma arctica JP610]KNC83425.1 hypothetical protein SARC_04314 [Sphaeroforma arctica JP610]|eukprot:XP_014157327.1 hypothetical protein SARC_04314 [Sphaeroforma arctica JP610]
MFSNHGASLPEHIADGDLDGDYYFIIWDNDILDEISLQAYVLPTEAKPLPPHKLKNDPLDVSDLGDDWFKEGQRFLKDPERMTEKRDISVLYGLWKDCAELYGLDHRDSRGFEAAFVQAIDQGKHGDEIELDDDLRARFLAKKGSK